MPTLHATHFEPTPHHAHAVRTRSRVLTSLVPLALSLFPAACAPGAAETSVDVDPDVVAGPEADAPAKKPAKEKEITLVALTPISRDRAPMLSHLADRFTLVEAAGRLDGATDPAELGALVVGASALVADVGQLSAKDLEAIRPFVDASAEAGVPLVLENIASSDRMAALVGLGLKADGALVESWDKARNNTITLLGHTDVERSHASEQVSIQKLQRAEMGARYWDMTDAERAAIAEKLGKDPSDLAADVDEAISQRDEAFAALAKDEAPASPDQVEATPDELAEQVAARLENRPLKPLALAISTYPLGTYKSYVVQRASIYTWQPFLDVGQTATMDVQFKVELVAASATNRKYMVVSDAGSGFNPGTLMWNNTKDRGYFQDSLVVSISHSNPALTSYAHQPLTANGTNTISNGCSFTGALKPAGPDTSFQCNLSSAATSTITDFTVHDQTAGLTAKWDFRMSFARADGIIVGGAYDDWTDLLDNILTGFLRNVPTLAKSTLDPQFEAIYWADGGFNDTVPISFMYKQNLRNTWIDYYFFVSMMHTNVQSATQTLSVSADFSRVGINEAWVPLAAKHSGKCLKVYGTGSESGAALMQWPCDDSDASLFEFVKTIDQDEYALIKPRHSLAYNMCLTVAEASTADYALLVQAPCAATGNDHQKFKLVSAGGNYYYVQAKHSGKCITVPNVTTMDGAAIAQKTCENTDNQRFK